MMCEMWSELRAERVRREIVATCREPISALDLLDRIAGLVDEAVPADASCWSTFDPATTMVTSAIGRGLDEQGDDAVRFFELEYALDAPGQYRAIASSGGNSATLDAAAPAPDAGHAATREHLQLMGIGQELRILFHQHGAAWGGAGLMRSTTSSSFTAEETSFLELIAPAVAAAVRAALVRGVPLGFADMDAGAAVLVLDRGEIVEMTPAAAQWLDQLRLVDRGNSNLPAVVRAVVAHATGGQSVAQRAFTGHGMWVVLRGAPLGDQRAVLTIEPAGPPAVTALLSAAMGLTGREIDVVTEVLRGSSTKEIAASLNLSGYTVQDHLKAIFAKAGVNSRRELIADVFFGVYAPRLGTPVSANGFFSSASSGEPSRPDPDRTR
jgi:DNA-binding CsgD family transcriptional regulator